MIDVMTGPSDTPTADPSDTPPAAPTGGLVAGLYWGVRSSFVDYIAASPDGTISGDDGVESDGQGQFRFPLGDTDVDGVAVFRGALRFTAHFGALDVELARPRVDLASGSLIVEVRGRPCEVAALTPTTPVTVGEWVVWPPIPATLTAAGAAVFGDVYAPGEALDELRLAVPRAAVAGWAMMAS